MDDANDLFGSLDSAKKKKQAARQIALFNHKGGVSKTTTAFNLGWMLAEKRQRVLLVDCDPQCNLTGMFLGFTGVEDIEKLYTQDGIRNIRDGLLVSGTTQRFSTPR
ncbi:ParA family protein [Mesorhizobium sp. LMG 17147]|uniref:ParA family protein n=1 Tax=Mesorhizobium sp. LMG 17147 TaxID=2963091 RepID=UPI0034A4D548